MTASILDRRDVLEPDHVPETVVGRDDEFETLSAVLSDSGTRLYLYGSRGTGKTLLTRKTVDEAVVYADTCYLSCIQHDTQYKVLAQLAETLTGEELTSGYHTAQLQGYIADLAADSELVVILDELDFLLLNDGGDLLYYLSRLDHEALNIVMISANHPDLSTVVDERTYSSLNPHSLTCEPYTVTQTYRILEQRARTALALKSFPNDALSHIATDTANLQLALLWLQEAAETATDAITEDLVREVRPDAVNRYRDRLLADFSPHHRLLCDVIEELTADANYVHTGAIYSHYESVCDTKGLDALTTRRLSDYLKHLELLGILEADYQYGGKEGKTRRIQLRNV